MMSNIPIIIMMSAPTCEALGFLLGLWLNNFVLGRRIVGLIDNLIWLNNFVIGIRVSLHRPVRAGVYLICRFGTKVSRPAEP